MKQGGVGMIQSLVGFHQSATGRPAGESHECAEHGTMARNGALGMAGRTRGVEDGRIILRVDLDFGQGSAEGQTIVEMSCRSRQIPVGPNDQGSNAQLDQARPGDFQAFEVGDQDNGSGVLQPICQFLGFPPGVHGDRDRPDGGDGRKGDDPFRIIAHRDRHSVAGSDRVLIHQQGAEGIDVLHDPAEAPAFIFVYQEDLVRRLPHPCVEFPQRGRGGLEDIQGLPAHLGLLDCKGGAGGREAGHGFVVAHAHAVDS